jgi:uncharacterized membrane protein (DUF4010 family)
MLGLVVATGLAGYILVKYGRRHLFLRRLWTARVSPEALKRRLDALRRSHAEAQRDPRHAGNAGRDRSGSGMLG